MELLDINGANLHEIVNYCWRVYQNPQTRFYPIVDSKEDIQSSVMKAYQDQSLFTLKSKGDLAVLPLYIDHESKYIQAVGGIAAENINNHYVEAFLGILTDQFRGYTFLIGYPSSNSAAIHLLKQRGFDHVESLLRYELDLDETVSFPEGEHISGLDKISDAEFCLFHNKMNPDVYWSGERILETRDRWTIRVVNEKNISGTACAIHYQKKETHYAEIYFVDCSDSLEVLINDMLRVLQRKHVRRVVYLVEPLELEKIVVLEKKGFKQIDDYHAYSIPV